MTNNERKKLKVKATNLTKRFEMLETTSNKMKTLFGLKRDKGQEFWALRNISFEVHDGETIGIIGLNGSGKSTISTLISGTMTPTTGSLKVNGNVSIIALGTGLIPNLTGRENIRVVGLMMGMTKKEISDKLDDIINFSELGPFIDQPLKTYSSGMKAKLSFSIAAYQDPDILIIDEVLSVGDGTFGQKSADKMFEFRKQGKTILLISHDMMAIEKWCDKVLWLHYGEVKGYGPTEEILPQYINFVQWFIHLSAEQQDEYKQRVRSEQLTYSTEILKEELADEYNISQKSYSRRGLEEQLNFVRNNKLSIATKLFLILLAFVCCIGIAFYTSSASSIKELVNPRKFLSQNLFQTSPSFSEKLNNEIISMSISAKKKEEKKIAQYIQKSTTTESSTKLTGSESRDKKSLVPSNSQQSSTKQTTSSSATQAYTIQAGDTLGEIAENHGTTIIEIQKINPGLDLSLISPGQIINLPSNKSTESQ
jgi:teichoic acid transport system ATP-binding protein